MCVCVQGTWVCQVALIGVTVVMLCVSPACYKLVLLTLSDLENLGSFDRYNVSDQVRPTWPSPPWPRLFLGVRGHPLRLGAAAHLAGGLFLPGAATSAGKGQCC